MSGGISDVERFEAAIAAFDKANAEDPNTETYNGIGYPKELLYAQRMTCRLNEFSPDAPEAVQLAAHCQHIRRWEIPRSDYPTGKAGYKRWRTDLYKFHAKTAAEILQEVDYDEETISRVETLLQKKRLKLDQGVQLLEDVICLVFLENYFADFSQQHDEEKLIGIVRKTWRKMSSQGQQAALALDFSSEAVALIEKATT